MDILEKIDLLLEREKIEKTQNYTAMSKYDIYDYNKALEKRFDGEKPADYKTWGGKKIKYIQEAEEANAFIKKYCSKYLSETNGAKYALYKGVGDTDVILRNLPGNKRESVRSWGGGTNPLTMVMKPLIKRPKNAVELWQRKMFDDVFFEIHGVKNLRAIAPTFATGSPGRVGSYGETYVIFPMGNQYTYWYNLDVTDFYLVWKKLARKSVGENPERLRKWMEEELIPGYTNKNLTAGIKSGVEIMFQLNKYYGVEIRFWRQFKKIIMG